MVLQALSDTRQQQAAAPSHFDCFSAFSVLAACLIPPVLAIRRSVAERGTRIGAE